MVCAAILWRYMRDLALLCWSHTSYQDLLPAFAGGIAQYFPTLRHGYVGLEAPSAFAPPFFKQLINNEEEPYWKRFVYILNQISEDLIIYCQEDFLLYDTVNTAELERVLQWMKDNDCACLKLLRSGLDSLSFPLSHRIYKSSHELAAVHQATIWRRDSLIKLMKACTPMHVRDFEKDQLASRAMADLGMQSCFYFHECSPKRGGHYDSLIFPYTATAISAGQWNMTEYGKEIKAIAHSYGLALGERGCL